MSNLYDQLDTNFMMRSGDNISFRKGTFLWALSMMMQGKKVGRHQSVAHVRMGQRMTQFLNNVAHWSWSKADITATDWELYEEDHTGEVEVTNIAPQDLHINDALKYFGGDSVEHLSTDRFNEPKQEWTLYSKDRALEELQFLRFVDEGVIDYMSPGKRVVSSEGMYWLPKDTRIWMSKDATDEEWAESIQKQVDEFRRKHDPAYYTGDAGDEDDGERATWWEYKGGSRVDIGGPAAKKEAKCECGSEKAKVPGHSSWCPKYKAADAEEEG